MRRESSTVVALVGDVSENLLAGVGRSGNVSVARSAAETADGSASSGSGQPSSVPSTATAPGGWEPGARAMRDAARRRSMYVIVPDDPLAAVAVAWSRMWDLSAAPAGAADFEHAAATTLAAWRARQFELPDYYLVVSPPHLQTSGADFYLGPLRSARPRRVGVAGSADAPGQASLVLDGLRALKHGPWWPPLDELVAAARDFYAGGLAETEAGE